MVEELLCNVLRDKNSKKNHRNMFEISHEERYTVIHLTLILMEITLLPFPWTFTTN